MMYRYFSRMPAWKALGVVCLWMAVSVAAEAQTISPEFTRTIRHNPDGSVTLGMGDKAGIVQGMHEGDPHAVQTMLASQTPFWSLLAASVLARMQGDFTQSDKQANRMVAYLEREGGLRDLEPLVMYAEILKAGNAGLAGSWKDWLVALHGLQGKYEKPLRDFFRIPSLKFINMDHITLNVPTEDLPTPSVDWAPVNHVDYVKTLQRKAVPGINPVVPVLINQQKVDAVLDTGVFISILPNEYLKSGGFKSIGKVSNSFDAEGRSDTGPLVVVDNLTIGKTVFHNVIFQTTMAKKTILGLQILKQFPHFHMTDTGVTFGPAAEYDCHRPMLLSSDPSANSAYLVFPVVSDQSVRYAYLDSGNIGDALFFEHVPYFSPEEQKQATSFRALTTTGVGTFLAVYRPMTATVDGVKLTGKVQKALRHIPSLIPDFLLTSALLQHGSFYFDFPTHTLCYK